MLTCVSIAAFASGCGYGTGTAGDNVDGSTPSESFHQGLESYPQGNTLYWIGPRTAGFRLAQTTDPAEAAALASPSIT